MSVWRQKAIDCLPESRKDFDRPGSTIYDAFIELLQKIYDFAEWCLGQKDKQLWNAAGVCFYEHLGDQAETREDLRRWVKPQTYNQIKGLLEWRLGKEEFQK
jgi:hypothetical protein